MMPQCCLTINTHCCQNVGEWTIKFVDEYGVRRKACVCNDHLHEAMKQLRLKGIKKPKARLIENLKEKVVFT